MEKNFECAYQIEEYSKDFLIKMKVEPKKLPCLCNPQQICYRWDFCILGKDMDKK